MTQPNPKKDEAWQRGGPRGSGKFWSKKAASRVTLLMNELLEMVNVRAFWARLATLEILNVGKLRSDPARLWVMLQTIEKLRNRWLVSLPKFKYTLFLVENAIFNTKTWWNAESFSKVMRILKIPTGRAFATVLQKERGPTGPFTINLRADNFFGWGEGGWSWDFQKTAGH